MEEPFKKEEKFKVRCRSCYKEVEVTLSRYGAGYTAICPECGKLAYNGDKRPSSIV